MHARSSRPALAAVAVALALAGCTATPRPAPSTPPESAPPTFPRIAGRTLEQRNPVAGDWVVRIRVDDAERAYASAKRTLEDAGYQLTKDRSGTDGGDGQACTTRQCVWFTATDDARWGPNLVYEVFHGQGTAP